MLETVDQRSPLAEETNSFASGLPASSSGDAPPPMTDPSLLKMWLLRDLAEARRLLETCRRQDGALKSDPQYPPDPPPERAIHLARRRLKRVRTLFLVVKSVAGAGHIDRAEAVKQAFQRLSGPRDADAMLKAARWLADRAGQKSRVPAASLVRRLEDRVASLRTVDAPVAEIVHLLRTAEIEAATLADIDDPIDLLRQRLVVAYTKGRKLFLRARDGDQTDDETLHDWRKQVKHRIHIGQVIEESRLAISDAPIRALDHLAEYLGEEHDFANLSDWICTDAALACSARDLACLTGAIARRRETLATRALELGAEFYGAKPATFAKSFG